MPADLKSLLRGRAVPNLAVLVKTRENAPALADIAPFSEGYAVPDSGSAYYLCEGGACAAPVFDLAALEKML